MGVLLVHDEQRFNAHSVLNVFLLEDFVTTQVPLSLKEGAVKDLPRDHGITCGSCIRVVMGHNAMTTQDWECEINTVRCLMLPYV